MSKGRLTRDTILQTAFEQASQQGLESLTIGSLATACEMSKSGLFAHFQSRDNLQIAVLTHSAEVFRERVIQPVRQQGYATQQEKLLALLQAPLPAPGDLEDSGAFGTRDDDALGRIAARSALA